MISERLDHAFAQVGDRLAGTVICPRCGANLTTREALCEARDGERCPGYVAIEAALAGSKS